MIEAPTIQRTIIHHQLLANIHPPRGDALEQLVRHCRQRAGSVDLLSHHLAHAPSDVGLSGALQESRDELGPLCSTGDRKTPLAFIRRPGPRPRDIIFPFWKVYLSSIFSCVGCLVSGSRSTRIMRATTAYLWRVREACIATWAFPPYDTVPSWMSLDLRRAVHSLRRLHRSGRLHPGGCRLTNLERSAPGDSRRSDRSRRLCCGQRRGTGVRASSRFDKSTCELLVSLIGSRGRCRADLAV
jgi:hypothetical protein